MATSVLGLKTFAASDPVDYNEVNDNYTKIDNGVKTAMQGRAAHNLLDNSNFSIAQAGQNGSHGSTKYVCDRWLSWDANATFGNGYITPVSPIDQHVSKDVIDINKTYTAAICLSDGTIKAESGTFANGFGSYLLGIYCVKQSDSAGYVTVRLNSGNNIRWAALYEGSYTADTLPSYVPKGYAAELSECQRYYYQTTISNANAVIASGHAHTSEIARFVMTLPQPMRIKPSFSFTAGSYIRIMQNGGTFNGTDISLNDAVDSTKQKMLFFVTSSGLTSYALAGLMIPGCTLKFSADL